MNKIFMFSDIYLPTFPYLEVPLYNYLKEKGIEVVYSLQEGDHRLTNPELSGRFGEITSLVVKKPKQIVAQMKKGDLLITRFAYKLPAGDLTAKARKAKHKILHYDPSGIDIRVRLSQAQYLTAKSESLKDAVLKKFPRKYKQIFVTGTIHNDAAAITQVDRKDFMLSYGLNPEKQLVILTPANPGEAWMKGLKSDYKKIVEIVKTKCPNYELVIKAHPMDYTAGMKKQPGIIHKNEHYKGKHSWEELAPGLKVIKAEEGYKALKACDAILNIRSSIAMETALFGKPLININREKYITNWPFDSKIMLDIGLEDLAFVLNTGNYSIDQEACKEYIKKECYSDDGLAYQRTGDVATKILNNEK